jgi:formate hydrogenlyase transcriptional activator
VNAGRRRFAVNAPGLKAKRGDGEEFEYDATMSCQEVAGRRLYTLAVRDLAERRRIEAEQHRLQLQSAYLQDEIKAVHNFEEIVGHTQSFGDVLAQIELVAATDSSVLILGETGTGKELIARAVHSRSTRADRPLIKVNCAALPAGLVESELFGYERGAFTGATERRTGRFELAHRGTIFLDEIGELPPEAQVKLLRVLQEREFERIGGTQTIAIDVRVIAATNRDLARMAADGTFRQDLYYRLNVFPVRLPPLRERREDIPLLVQYFIRRYAAKIGRGITGVTRAALRRLTDYPWPGNVRELENVIERAVILSTGTLLEVPAEALPAPARTGALTTHGSIAVAAAVPAAARIAAAPHSTDDETSLDQVERRHIVAVLRQTRWRIEGQNGAARILNLNPSTLRSRMQKLGIRRSSEDRV